MRRLVLVVAALAALMLTGSAAAEANSSFKAKLDGVASIVSLPTGTPSLDVSGEGHAPRAGKFEFVGGLDLQQQPTAAVPCATISSGALILSAQKERGQLVMRVATATGRVCLAGPGGTLTVAMDLAAATGRFEGVPDSARLTGTLTPNGGSFRFSGELTGR